MYILLMVINLVVILGYSWLLVLILLVDIGYFFIGGYYINGYY